MRYFVVPSIPTAQIPDPDRGGFIPATGITLSSSSRLADYIARGDVVATPIDAVTPAPTPSVDPLVDALTLQGNGIQREITVRGLEDILLGSGRPIPNAIAAAIVNTATRYRTVTAAKAATILSSVQTLDVGGYSTPGIGAALYMRSATTGAGPGRFQSADGAWWSLAEAVIGLEMLGAGVGDAVADLAAIRAARSLTNVVRLDAAIDVTGQNPKALDGYDLIVRGRGSIKGLYRKRVIPDGVPSDTLECAGDLIPGIHLKRFNAAQNPVWVHTGDSLSGEDANSNGKQDGLTVIWEDKLRRACQARGTTLTYYNRAIGGISWSTLASTSAPSMADAAYPGWYTNRVQRLLDYVKALNPDGFSISLGMNLTGRGDIEFILAVIAYVSTWAKVPDIVFMTNTIPRPFAQPGLESFGLSEFTEARIRSAGLIRTLVKSGKLALPVGLIDFARKQMMVQFGFDPCVSALRGYPGYATGPAAGAPSIYGAMEAVEGNYETTITFDPTKLVLGGPQVIALPLGGGGLDVVQISKSGADSNSYLASFFAGLTGGGVYAYATVPFTMAPNRPDGTTCLRCCRADGSFRIYPSAPGFGLTGEDVLPYTPPLITVPLVTHGGSYAPYVQESPGGLACIKAVKFYYGDPRLNTPTATADQLWDTGEKGIGLYGGSGNIHYANFMDSHVIRPVLDATILSHPLVSLTQALSSSADPPTDLATGQQRHQWNPSKNRMSHWANIGNGVFDANDPGSF